MRGERGHIFLAFLMTVVLSLLVYVVLDGLILEPQARRNYAASHNLSEGDVRAFCRLYDIKANDLRESEALKKQLDRFLAGEKMDAPVKKKRPVVVPVIVR
jgi:hypothetical protein